MAHTAYEYDILGLLQRLAPGKLLGIGAKAGELVQTFAAQHPGRRALELQVSEDTVDLDFEEPFDCVLVTDTLEHLPKRQAGILLSRLRDLYARYLLVAVPVGASTADSATRWSEPDLLAYGLRRLGRYGDLCVYSFDIYDYKLTPDWLNSKYWAHPELFDKYWW